MLRTALGPAIAAWLEDAGIVEVMLNPDGRLWVDRLSGGMTDTGERLAAADGERIVRLVAHHVGAEVHPASPRVSAELPETGERFEGLLPPVVTAPAFAIRKPAVAVFTLDDYVAAGILTAARAEGLRNAVRDRQNILVAGGTSTGKTTLTNALLAEIAKTADRVFLLLCFEPATTAASMAIWRPRTIGDAPAGGPERSRGRCCGDFLASRGMGRTPRGRKSHQRRCGSDDRGEAGLRPDQAINEATCVRVLNRNFRRRLGVSRLC